MLAFLIANDEPMPWYQTGPSVRVAQIIFLASRLGVPDSAYMPAFEREAKFITNQLPGTNAETFIKKVTTVARQKPKKRVA